MTLIVLTGGARGGRSGGSGRGRIEGVGGTTGDVLGAAEQVGELAVLVSAASLAATHGWSWL